RERESGSANRSWTGTSPPHAPHVNPEKIQEFDLLLGNISVFSSHEYRNSQWRSAMRLALHTDYALRTLLYVATEPRRATVNAIADFYGISAHHLGKVVHQLGRLGYVRSMRGPGGGIALARAAEGISVGEVIRDFEERGIHLLECVDTPGVCVIQP